MIPRKQVGLFDMNDEGIVHHCLMVIVLVDVQVVYFGAVRWITSHSSVWDNRLTHVDVLAHHTWEILFMCNLNIIKIAGRNWIKTLGWLILNCGWCGCIPHINHEAFIQDWFGILWRFTCNFEFLELKERGRFYFILFFFMV